MKKILFVVLLPFCFMHQGYAQSHNANSNDQWGDLRLGPLASGGAAVNAGDVASGSKTAPLFSYTAGGKLNIPFSPTTALDLSLAYDQRSINFHDQATSDLGVDYSFGYIAFRSTVKYEGFTVGLGVGYPVYAGTTSHGGANAPDIAMSNVNTLFEGRLGGEVKVWETDLGILNLSVEGTYAFNRILTPSFFHGVSDTQNNGPLASLEFGVNYLFNVMRHEEAPRFAQQ